MRKYSEFKFDDSLIGKYINYYGYSDIEPIGKIIALKGKSSVVVKLVEAGENKTKMEFIPGGFAGHCINQFAQSYDYTEKEETKVMRISKKFFKYYGIADAPHKYYDYNF